jgi:uncharacterized protein YbaA (DUF1428 family)
MTYVEGFVAAVPAANKEQYRMHAAEAAPLFSEFGVTRMVETWGDDVPKGKINDFMSAVQAKDDEVVVFSWFEYPSKAARDAANEKIMSDPRMKRFGASMPFDASRMVVGGFDSIIDRKGEGTTGYVDGYLLAAPTKNRDAYREMVHKVGAVFLDHGAVRVVEAWGDDVPRGKVTDHWRAVHAKDDETVVYSWIEWPSKEVRDAAWPKIMQDPRMNYEGASRLFDGQRMIYGGFVPILDT